LGDRNGLQLIKTVVKNPECSLPDRWRKKHEGLLGSPGKLLVKWKRKRLWVSETMSQHIRGS